MKTSPLTVTSCSVLALLTPAFWTLSPVIVWNMSPSSPVGLYLLQKGEPKKEDFIAIRLSKWAANLAETRNYLPKSALLIKRVAAVQNDTICRVGDEIFINTKRVAKALRQDKKGRDMPFWTGCLMLSAKQFFLLSADKDAFDGRYFGPVNRSQILGIARPIWLREALPKSAQNECFQSKKTQRILRGKSRL